MWEATLQLHNEQEGNLLLEVLLLPEPKPLYMYFIQGLIGI